VAAFGLSPALLPPRGAEAGSQEAPPASRRAAHAQRPARTRGGGNLVQRLNLTPEQRRQLREIRAEGEPEARELTRRVRLARRSLDEAIYSDAVEEPLVEQRARELAAAQAALMRLRAATELKVRRVLTAEQLRTFRELRRQAARRQQLQRRLRGARREPPPGEMPPDAGDPPLK
jgi:Spy/CpxP family protein refolding chaperone